ncbi:MAG: hypothetical protein PWQ97_432 [Tepidanaerobacteraceae bacterium]|nr:hypothetical protein [Tepidanaerobacteraceae bacterium]
MIVQKDPNKPNNVIKVNPEKASELNVENFQCGGLNVTGKTLDLTQFQGGPFRLYVDKDGSLSTELYKDHFWLIAEAFLPEKQYDNIQTGRFDENGQPISEMVERPLNLDEVDIVVFPLPEVV